MPLYRPSELREFLSSIDKNPMRFSSQRFLIDGNVVAKIVDEVATKNVLEIGSGPGVLTEALLAANHVVVAIEKDREFARTLHRLSSDHLVVKEADVLDCSLEDIGSGCFHNEPFTVVSNLPYHLTTPIIEWLLASSHLFSKAVLMVQKEAAVRLTAQKGGYLPLLLAYTGKVRQCFTVSQNSFWPKPRVDSSVISCEPTPKKMLPNDLSAAFFSFLREIFSHKRKTLLHSLGVSAGKEKAARVLEELKISPQTRPEDLFLTDFVAIFKFLCQECHEFGLRKKAIT